MSHHHHHSHTKGLSVAFWLNLLFSIIEVAGGIFTNSTAIIADAFHDFMDALTIGAAVWLEKVSAKKRTAKFTYGYKRFSLLAALGMSVFILVGAVLMCVAAVRSFYHPEPVNSSGMLWIAVLGIAINGIAFWRMRKEHDHHHEDGYSHSHNSRAVMLHLLEDVLGWVAVLIGAVVIYFTGWYWIDGVLALAIAVFIGYNATKNLIGTVSVLLQSVPEAVDVEKLCNELSHIEGVDNIHDLHVWSLDGSYNVATLHAVVQSSKDEIFIAIIKVLKKYHIQHPTIQFETSMDKCGLVRC
ncbi:MAG TPA: cation diffusion facilitator family transporter [Niastella sp.]|nr:cation diffusion facilitator family transporter [Niastella sp.]